MATPRKTKSKKTASPKEAVAKPKTKAAAKPKPAPPMKAESRAKAEPKPAGAIAQETKKRKVEVEAPLAKPPARPARAKAEAPKAEPAPPKVNVDPELLKTIREALVNQRQRLMSLVKSTREQMAERATALPDVSDQASEGYGDELAVGLMAIEAAQLEDIQAAIDRIDASTYGVCLDCCKPIPRKRLEVLPFARRCLACEGAREQRARRLSSFSDEEDDDERRRDRDHPKGDE